MAEDEFKQKLSAIIKKHGMKAKIVTKAINRYASKLDREGDEKEEMILDIVKMAAKEKIEVQTAFLLRRVESKSEKNMSDILEHFNKMIKEKRYKDDVASKTHREKLVVGAIKAKIAWEARVQTKMFDILVLGKALPRTVPTKSGENTIANLAVFCIPLEDDGVEPFYRNLTFWGDVGIKVNKLIIGHRYHCNLVRNRAANSLDAWDPVDQTEFTDKGKFEGDIQDILEKMNVQQIDIAEAEFNVTKGYTECSRIDCEIMSRQILTRGDRDIGMMFVIDESSEDMIYGKEGDDSPSGGFSIFSDPQNLVYGEGSDVVIIGRIRKNPKDDRISMNADAVIPIMVVPINLTPVDDEEDVDMSTGDEAVIDPDTLSELDGGGTEDPLMDDEDIEDDDDDDGMIV